MINVKVDGESVEVELFELSTAELIRASIATLARPEVGEQVPHQAFPREVTKLIEGGEPSEMLHRTIQELKLSFCAEREVEQAVIDERQTVRVGDVELRSEKRKWTIHSPGEKAGRFTGPLILFAELMAIVNRDVAVEDSGQSWAYRPWLLVRDSSAWKGKNLAPGHPKKLRGSQETLSALLAQLEALDIPTSKEVPAWARKYVEVVDESRTAFRSLLADRGIAAKSKAPSMEVKPVASAELRAFAEYLSRKERELSERTTEFEVEMAAREHELDLRTRAAVQAETLALRP